MRSIFILALALFAASVPDGGVRAAAADLRLVQAARRGDPAAVRTLLRQRVDVNAAAADGSTALLWAAYRSDPTRTGAGCSATAASSR